MGEPPGADQFVCSATKGVASSGLLRWTENVLNGSVRAGSGAEAKPMHVLIEKARSGDKAAIVELLSAQKDRLLSIAESRLGAVLRGKLHLSDILQSTILDVIRSLSTFRGSTIDDFEAWTIRVLENNIRDKGRFYLRARREDSRLVDGSELTNLVDTASPESPTMLVDDLLLVSEALDELPADVRTVLKRRFIDGASYAEIAAETGKNEGAVRVMCHRGRADLLLRIERGRRDRRDRS
jgi:RNA polymerase sigma factor (sigma-70 family)